MIDRMEERARRLALRPPEQPAVDEESFIVFRLGDESYAIASRCVREIVRPTHITTVPGTPDFIAGLTNFRGEMLALVDLRRFFGLPSPIAIDFARVIVCGGDDAEVGIVADEAEQLRTFDPATLQRPSAHECCLGLTEDAVLVLDGIALMSNHRLIIEDGKNRRET